MAEPAARRRRRGGAVDRRDVRPYRTSRRCRGWAWLFWAVVIASGESVWPFPNVVFVYVGAISPALAGVVMVRRTAGGRGLRELWSRIRDPRRIPPLRGYAVIVLPYPALTLLVALVVTLVGTSDAPVLDPARPSSGSRVP